ncbi:hypothetical protein [Carboxydothermus ferrireducens]|uniref:tRNA A37 threonylcarbamoyladenosine biosynthesis protein TsaE n=1 Tax=Carboxydothermus ferrireducens DSM 11255 TaxID=1119529 RepID=A0ABX2R7Y3_9THEO|nr:hypothetical protein [Carboxydothermus ferrireducens]NYE57286.1 tRNA A37 threonylcarbamoyladenosine biosynthesis protein TsaE [Carboxydothermus ferrireducens DSM 11255]
MNIYPHEYLLKAVYFAPRGKHRLMALGSVLAERYLSPKDKLVGLIGDAGAGKSLLIRGMFPGLELTNDDEGINLRPLPLLEDYERGNFRHHSYHVDMRFEMAFTPPYRLAEAVKKAIDKGRRVVIEHFDLLYPYLNINAELLIGVGAEVILFRPNVFGPFPHEVANEVFPSLVYRKMAHSAEDLTGYVLKEMGIIKPEVHSDIRNGFLLEFKEKPEIDLEVLEKRVKELIAQNLSICYYDEEHIKLGQEKVECTGPRIHVSKTGEIKGFKILKELKYDPIEKLYIIAGVVGQQDNENEVI